MQGISETPNLQAAARPRTLDSRAVLLWGGLLLIVALSIGLRTWDLGSPNLWVDEVRTEYRAQAPIEDSLRNMLRSGNQGPVYYVLMRPFTTETEFQLRFPNVLIGTLGILGLMLMAQRMTGSLGIALWVGLLMAVNPFHIMLSRNARAYPLVFLLTLAVMASFFWLLAGKRSRATWVTFTAASSLAYMTHYTTGALAVAQFIILALNFKRYAGMIRTWVIAQIIAVLPFGIWGLMIVSTMESTTENWTEGPSLFSVPITLWNLVFGYDGSFSIYLLPAMLIVALGLGLGAWWAWKERQQDVNRFYMLVLVLATIVPVTLVSVTITPAYKDRYFTVMQPALILLLVMGLHRLHRPQLFHGAMGLLVVVSLFNIGTLLHAGDHHRTDWDELTAAYVAGYQPGDGLIVERDNAYQAFLRYFEGDPAMVEDHIIFVDVQDTADYEAAHERIWLVYRNPIENIHRMGRMPDFDPFTPETAPTGDWLVARQERVIEVQEFLGVALILLEGSGTPD